jgi:stage III sporulation protein AD
MEIFLKSTACILIAVVLCLILSKNGKDYSMILILAVCAMVFLSAGLYLQPILAFLERLVLLGNLNSELLDMLLKIAGIGFISQIASLTCADTGNKVLERTLQILSVITVLWIAVPILEEMLQMMESLLEAV